MAWRASNPTSVGAAGCNPLVIPTGTVIVGSQTIVLVHEATYTPTCNSDGELAVAVHSGRSIFNLLNFDARDDPTVFRDWQGGFSEFLIPTIYASAATAAIIWTLCASLFMSQNRRPFFLKAVSLIAAACIAGMLGSLMVVAKNQYDLGYLDGASFQWTLTSQNAFQIFQIICQVMLLIAEVLTVGRIFPRKREKRLVIWSGMVLAVLSGILWLVDFVAPDEPADRNTSLDAAVVFAYLFSIATAILYACCIAYFTLLKWKLTFRLELIAWTSICNLTSLVPIVLFILDLVDASVEVWDDYATVSSIMIAYIGCWIWMDKVEDTEAKIRAQGVLGKEIYTEDTKMDIEKRPRTLSASQESEESSESSQDDDQSPHAEKSAWSRLAGAVTAWIDFRPGTASTSRTNYVITSRYVLDDALNRQIARNRSDSDANNLYIRDTDLMETNNDNDSTMDAERPSIDASSSNDDTITTNTNTNDPETTPMKLFIYPTKTLKRT